MPGRLRRAISTYGALVLCLLITAAIYLDDDRFLLSVERRLGIVPEEPYVDLKDKCVTISTDWLTITGRYDGMRGPSLKPVRFGDPRPGDLGPDDDYKIYVPVGNIEFFNTAEIPPPSAKHLELLAMEPDEQAQRLATAVMFDGHTCNRPYNPYFRGLDESGIAYWAIVCEDGKAFAVRVSDEHGIHGHFACESEEGFEHPECFAPCSRSACYTLDLEMWATDEWVPYTPSVQVERAPVGACPTKYAGFVSQGRGKLPELDDGEKHRPVMTIADPPDCRASDQPGEEVLVRISAAAIT